MDPPPRKLYTSQELDRMMTTSDPVDPSDPTEEDQKVLALFDSLVEEDMNEGVNGSSSSDSFSALPDNIWPFNSDSTLTDSELSLARSSSLEPLWSHDDFNEDGDLIDTYGSDADDWYSSSDDWWHESAGSSSEEQSEDASGEEKDVGVAGSGVATGNAGGSEERESRDKEKGDKEADSGDEERGNGRDEERNEEKGREDEEKIGDKEKGEEEGESRDEERDEERGDSRDKEKEREGEGGATGTGEKASGRKGKRKMENGANSKEDNCREKGRKRERLELESVKALENRICKAASCKERIGSIDDDDKEVTANGECEGASLPAVCSCSADGGKGSKQQQQKSASLPANKTRAKPKKSKTRRSKTDPSTGGASHASATSSNGNDADGACGGVTSSMEGSGAGEEATAGTRTRSKRQRLLHLQSSAAENDFRAYSAELFLKTKPASHFYSPASSNGNSSKKD